jgi:uncharacterized lipoprotein YmbA
MNRSLHAVLVCVLMGLSLVGCGTLSPRSDPSRFFTLTPLPQAEEAGTKGAGNPAGISLGIGPVTLPGYLDRQEIVTRVAQNRIDLSENDRWAEPLAENFTRALAQNLSSLLQTDRLVFYPWELNRKPNYQVEIEVLRFESNASGDAQLSARWAVLDVNKKNSQSKESRLARPAKGKSTEAAIAALSEALGDFSREIADAVRSIDGKIK